MKNIFCVLFVYLGFVELAYSQVDIEVFEYLNENGKSVFLNPIDDSLILDYRDLGLKTTLYLDIEALEVEGMAVYVGEIKWKSLNCEIFVQFLDEFVCTVDSECEDLSLGICQDKNATIEIMDETNPFLSESPFENEEEVNNNPSFIDGEEFIEFSLLDAKEKYSYLIENSWGNLGVKSYSEDGILTEEWNFYKEINEKKYFLTLIYVMNGNDGTSYNVSKISLNSETVYTSWVKDIKGLGYNFVKDPESADRYMVLDDDIIIYIEKRKVKDIVVFEISVIN